MPLSEICPLISVVSTPLGLVNVQTRFLVQGKLEEYLPDWWIEAKTLNGEYGVLVWNRRKKWEFTLRYGQSATVVYERGYIFRHTELDPRRSPARILHNVITGRYRIKIHPGYRPFFEISPAK